MRKLLLIAGVAVLAVPGLALAQPGCREQQHDNRVAGTVAGAVSGAALGGAISGRAAGAVVGGASITCADYPQGGFYDSSGVWHAASGHYDADGNWVDDRPPAVDYGPAPPNPIQYGADAAYTGPRDDLSGREDWLQQRISEGASSGAISRSDADDDMRTLTGIRAYQTAKAAEHRGLTGGDRANIVNKLDDLDGNIRGQWTY
jgi:hypothetical protein